MNRTSTAFRLAAAATALTVTFAIFQTISTAYTSVPAEMLAKSQAAKGVLVASK